MKDIGSIFPLYDEDIALVNRTERNNVVQGSRINFSLCREAMFAVASKYESSSKVVLIPSYTCQAVIDPFVQLGWTCYFYNIKKNLRIDTDDILQKSSKYNPSLLVVHPFHGMELLNEELDALRIIKRKGCILLEDVTQCIYEEKRPDVFDYFTGSYRKWFKVPDGGFLEARNLDGLPIPSEENHSFVQKQTDAMFLRGNYFKTSDENIKAISIRLNKEAVKGIGVQIECHRMSAFSINIMEKENHENSIQTRFDNYKYLYYHIKESCELQFVCKNLDEVTTAPLYFPIYVSNRSAFQRKLANKHIYAPVLWPVQTKDVLKNEEVEYIYSHILMLPIDQRYSIDDMIKIVELANGKD